MEDVMDILEITTRWLHVASVVVLIGGLFYATFFARSFASSFRPVIWATLAAIIGTGLYNLLTMATVPDGYHMVFGIKMLFVLHILVVGLLASTNAVDDAKRVRLLKGVAISGILVVLMSAYLRSLGAA
jgi:hypothetical protein